MSQSLEKDCDIKKNVPVGDDVESAGVWLGASLVHREVEPLSDTQP